jgi:hypothetical protein
MKDPTLKKMQDTYRALINGYGCVHDMDEFLSREVAKLEAAKALLVAIETIIEGEDYEE